MQESQYTELIAKKLSGNIQESEKEVLEEWINRSTENKETYDLYVSLWSNMKIKRVSKNVESVYAGISAAIQEDDTEEKNRYLFRGKERKLSYLWIGIAASLVLLITTVFVFTKLRSYERTPVTQNSSMIEKSLPRGQKMKIFLPDGSTVWLNSESSLIYPERFNENSRVVELRGEAFFDVSKDPSKPFIVKTNGLDVTVLGTTFNVRNYNSEQHTEVALESGKVLVETTDYEDKKYILSPGEGFSLNSASGKGEKYEVDPKYSFEWKDGVIYFRDAALEDVMNKLSRWYGVEFAVENYRGDKWEYSAEFKNDYLDNILKSMSFTKGFKYEIDQNKVRIMFN